MSYVSIGISVFVVVQLLMIRSQALKLRAEVTKLRLVVDPDPVVRERLAKRLEVGMLG